MQDALSATIGYLRKAKNGLDLKITILTGLFTADIYFLTSLKTTNSVGRFSLIIFQMRYFAFIGNCSSY